MSELLLTSDECERVGCLVSLRYSAGPVVMVFLGRDTDINAGRGSKARMAESVKVYCSHRCEALARPTPAWSGRTPERGRP